MDLFLDRIKKLTSALVLFLGIYVMESNVTAAEKVIVFDLGEVILKLNWEKTLSTLGVNHSRDKRLFHKLLTSHEGAYDLFERGLMNEKEFMAKFKEELAISASPDEIEKAWEHLIVGPVEGIEKLLDRIPQDYDLYLLTNISENLYRYLKLDSTSPLYPVLSKFKKTYASFRLHMRKPEVQIYEAVLKDLKKDHPKLVASDILFIDDRQDNADGAKKAGFKGEKCNPSDVRHLEEILKHHEVF
jgi:glucose-1-phosphatase